MIEYRESHYKSLNDRNQTHRIVYSDWGPVDGRPVICVHGLTGNGRDFDWLAADLATHGFRVIAVDMPGRGRSDFLADPEDYNYQQYVRDLTALMAHLDITKPGSVDWIGVSLGGLLGMNMAAAANSPIQRMVINDIGPHLPQEDIELIAQYISQTYEFTDIKEMEDFMRATRGLTWGPITDEQWAQMARNNARSLDNGSITYGFDPAISVVFEKEPAGMLDLWQCWDNINAPVLVLRGSESTIFPQNVADEMMKRGPGAQGEMTLEIIEGCGHVPSLMTPDQIAIIRDWLLMSCN